MGRLFAIGLACLLLAACTTTATKVAFNNPAKPPPGAKVVIVEPDVRLSLLTAGGVTEPRDDWSQAGARNLSEQLQAQLNGRSHGIEMLDPAAQAAGRANQLLRLNDAVGRSILFFSYGGVKLPTKAHGFDWTIGEGAKSLREGADYALFVNAMGTYASGGRVATAIGMSLLGVSVPLGQQQVFASLVDLRTGQVVWFNIAVAGPSADMREVAGATALTQSLLKDIPL
jgi:hypothetical protein